jgi:hypothetical protein
MTKWNAPHVTQKADEFCKWLTANGAQVLVPTNEWELIRFKNGFETSIIYKDKRNNITFIGSSLEAWAAFKNGQAWRASPATKRKRSGPLVQSVRARDGANCFYCLEIVNQEDESLEHLVAITHGGPNHISNLFLTHWRCNESVGHLSAVEKIKLHVEACIKKLEPPKEQK